MATTQAAESVPSAHPISVEFYSRKGNREEVLINASGAVEPLDGKSRWFSYSFVRPVYLMSIEIKAEGYQSFDRFELVVEHVDGTYHEERISVTDGSVNLKLGKLCRSFRFKPDKKYFGDPKLLSVIAAGFTEDEFHEFEWKIKEYEKKVSEIKAREDRLATQLEEASELRAERAELEAAIGRSKAESEQLEKGIAASNARKSKLEEQLTQLQKSATDTNERLTELQPTFSK